MMPSNLSDDEWEPLPDTDYYGEIPNGVTGEQLISIMVQGLFRYARDLETHGIIFDNLAEILEDMTHTLDRWCEHDSLRGDNRQFSHLIDEDHEFFDLVSERLRPLLAQTPFNQGPERP